MKEYALLLSPSANRVYADTSLQMMQSEIRVFDSAVLGGKIGDIGDARIGGVSYLVFTSAELTDRDLKFLSNLSSLYALFEVRGDLLRPLPVDRLDMVSSDLLTIQKYSGKTNDQFTKLLLNVTAISTDAPGDFLDKPLRVLDPMCGRGTTLNQALMYGYDPSGIDIDGKDFDAYALFIRTWLKNKRIKHQAEMAPIRRNKERLGRRLDVTLGITKEQYKAGEVRTIAMVNGDTLRSAEFFRSNSFDVLVADTPYGVQHGSHEGRRNPARSPMQLLAEAILEWARLVRPGGAIGLSWNTVVGERAELARLLEGAGFAVRDTEPYLGFRHRVDQAINRDLIVATKPGMS